MSPIRNKAEFLALRQLCADYNPQPIYEMEKKDLRSFALRQARAAIKSCSLDADEYIHYAQAIYDSIRYFIQRDTSHANYMNYIEECRIRHEKEQQLREEEKKKNFFVFHVIS